MRLSNQVILASLNRSKYEEFVALFRPYPTIQLIQAASVLRNPEGLALVERHSTYMENAIAKARLANWGAHYSSLADDTGLEVPALEGRPGVRSHRYAVAQKGQSQDQANVEKLLGEMKSASDRAARFVCALALVVEGVLVRAEGILEGQIIETPRGKNGFGYDCVFVPNGQGGRTLAEMASEEKNKVSHRALAVRALMEQVQNLGIALAKP